MAFFQGCRWPSFKVEGVCVCVHQGCMQKIFQGGGGQTESFRNVRGDKDIYNV